VAKRKITMKIYTLNKKSAFAGATLPLRRTNAGQYYVHTLEKDGPAVSIDLLLSNDARLLVDQSGEHGVYADLLLRQVSIEREGGDGKFRLCPQADAAAATASSTPKVALVWIPDAQTAITRNPARTCGGISLLLENLSSNCERLAAGLVKMEVGSSFTVSIYTNTSEGRPDEPRLLESYRFDFSGYGFHLGENLIMPEWPLHWA
jgi:hypothetical protein